MLKVVERIINKTKFNFEYIDLGGGMGIDYENKKKFLNLKKYSVHIKKFLKNIKRESYLNLVDQLLVTLVF